MQFVTQLFTGTAMTTAACKQRNNHVTKPTSFKETLVNELKVSEPIMKTSVDAQLIKKFPDLWNPQVHCCLESSLRRYLILSQMNSYHNHTPNFLRFILILSPHQSLRLPTSHLSMRATCLAHLIPVGKEYRWRSSCVFFFSIFLLLPISSVHIYFPQHFFLSNILILCSSHSETGQTKFHTHTKQKVQIYFNICVFEEEMDVQWLNWTVSSIRLIHSCQTRRNRFQS